LTNQETSEGLVVRVTGGEVWVDVAGDVLPCILRGRLRRDGRPTQVVAGDRVGISMPAQPGDSPAIDRVHPRASYLARYIPRGDAERLIVANVETLFVVATFAEPRVNWGFVDRVLVAAEFGDVRPCVILNKIDLVADADIADFESVFEATGYDVVRTSALTGQGVDELTRRVGEGVYAFVGESGVGKSSLLMRIDPELDLKVRGIGGRTKRGRHTTTFSQLYKFGNGYLADTPGVQTFSFPGDEAAELPACFPEFAPFSEGCHFWPCSHSHEPDCAVKSALQRGDIHESRYKSYIDILADVVARSRKRTR